VDRRWQPSISRPAFGMHRPDGLGIHDLRFDGWLPDSTYWLVYERTINNRPRQKGHYSVVTSQTFNRTVVGVTKSDIHNHLLTALRTLNLHGIS
jgi:hypothetical protein